MIPRRTANWLLFALICISTLAGCSDKLQYNGPCEPPSNFKINDVVGVWQIEYHNFLGEYLLESGQEPSRVNGTERIVIRDDGTYTQTFTGPELEYQSAVNRWEYVEDLDGPKLAMYGLKYLASGVEYRDTTMRLYIEIAELVRFTEEYGIRANPDFDVNYPEEGFIYLYPRICPQKIGLVQMTTNRGDPDSPGIHNPVFEKVGE